MSDDQLRLTFAVVFAIVSALAMIGVAIWFVTSFRRDERPDD